MGRYVALVLLIALPAIFTYWVANYNNRFPTLLDGTWDVVEVSSNLQSTPGNVRGDLASVTRADKAG